MATEKPTLSLDVLRALGDKVDQEPLEVEVPSGFPGTFQMLVTAYVIGGMPLVEKLLAPWKNSPSQ